MLPPSVWESVAQFLESLKNSFGFGHVRDSAYGLARTMSWLLNTYGDNYDDVPIGTNS